MLQIATSFRTFGITPTTTALLLIKVTTPATPEHTPESIQAHIISSIEAQQIPFTDENLDSLTDWPKVKKAYKLNATGNAGKKMTNGVTKGKEVDENKELEIMVLGSMALRGATS